MNLILALTTGILFGGGMYLMLRRSMVKLVVGLSMISHSVIFFLLSSGNLQKGGVPILPADGTAPLSPLSDPLPQALILTAIVISFSLTTFSLVLVYRTFSERKTLDADTLREEER